MHGVILGNLEIGSGPSTPGEMVDLLDKPLRTWLALDWDRLPPEIADLVAIADGELTDEAFDIGSSYVEALFDPVSGGLDGGRDWLPSWAWQTAEQTEHSIYMRLAGGSQTDYVAGRLMLVEVTAGTTDSILREYDQRRAPRMDVYVPIPPERVWSGKDSWWWPCPDCQYPMRIAGSELRCDFPPHRRVGRFVLSAEAGPARPPRVLNAKRAVKAERAEGVMCLEWAIWRHMTVPGLTEVALMRWLEGKGVTVERWEKMDSWDLGVTLPNGWSCQVDVKDRADSRDIIANPPRADYIVVPTYRADQVGEIRRGLDPDRYTVCTVARFKAIVTAQLNGAAQ
jgi:REase associating with pPIWI_RE/pPIWI_RE three-gene island domain Y